MIKFYAKFLIVFALFLFANNTKADIIGGEISYKHLSNKKYEVTLKVYRECAGLALPNLRIFIVNTNSDTLFLPTSRTSINEVSINCLDTGNGICISQNTNNSSTSGLELHTFMAEVDFDIQTYKSFLNSTCIVRFGSFIGTRKLGGSLFGNYNTPFYIEAMIDLCKSKKGNSSVQYPVFKQFNLLLNNPFGYSFAGSDNVDLDSIDYQMATPKIDYKGVNSFSYGNTAIPITPFCPPNPGVINCKPLPNASPPRGFYFDKRACATVFTPTGPYDHAIFSFIANEYRTDSVGNKVLIGFSTRELILLVKNGVAKNKIPKIQATNFSFKVGENKCYEIKTNDEIGNHKDSANNGDETQLTIVNSLPGSSFYLKDSTAKQKTGVYCFKMTAGFFDSIKNKGPQIAIFNAKDNYCPVNAYNTSGFLINFLPPDSLGKIKINTFLDHNKDGIRNNGEPFIKTKIVLINSKQKSVFYETKANGTLEQWIEKGKYSINNGYNFYLTQTTKDASISLAFRDSIALEIGFAYKSGIYGRVFEDKNKNCLFDNLDKPLEGYLIKDSNKNIIGISDAEGYYFLKTQAGSHQISCVKNGNQYTIFCPSNNILNLNTIADSAYWGNDFAIENNQDYTDVAVYIQVSKLAKGEKTFVNVNVKNNGNKTRKAIPIEFELVINSLNGTNNWKKLTDAENTVTIDSIAPFSERNLLFLIDENRTQTNFVAGNTIYFKAKTNQSVTNSDSLKTNNNALQYKVVNKAEANNNKHLINDSTKTRIDKTIDFSISFKNMGTDTLKNIIVSDTINLKYFNMRGFKLKYSKNKCKTWIVGNVIHFILENINLPQFDEANNNNTSFVNFSLGLNSDIENETNFENQATLDFDFSRKEQTNLAKGQIISPIKVLRLKNKSTCMNDSNTIVFEHKIITETNNQIFVELSDSLGKFTNPFILGFKNTNKPLDSLQFRVPKLSAAGNYRIRIRTTSPASISIDSSGRINLSIKKASSINISNNLTNNSICEKQPFVLNFNSANPHQLFKNNTEQLPKGVYSNYIDTLKQHDIIKIVMHDANNSCTDTLIISPNVVLLPQVFVSVVDRKDDYCENETITIAKYLASRYNTFLNGNKIENNTTDTFFNIKLTQNSTIIVQGFNSFGCSAFSDSIFLRVHPLPVAIFTIDKNKICNYDSAVLTINNDWEKEVYKNNQLLVSSSFAKRFVFGNIINQDSFYFKTISDQKCEYITETKVIEVVQQPATPIINRTDNTLFISTNDKVDWYFNNTLFASNKDSIFNCPSGSYFAIVSNVFGCKTRSVNYAFINTKVRNNDFSTLKIYPNPSNGVINIEMKDASNPINTVLIYNFEGKLVKTISNVTSQFIKVEADNLNTGIYTVVINTENGVITRKVSIVK